MQRVSGKASWMIIGAILAAGALSTAGLTPLGDASTVGDGSTVGEVSPPQVVDATDDTGDEGSTGKERKRNHGYYVSRAAHCEDVSDPETGISFTAPDDCTGRAKGEYVSSVAHSNLGKKSRGGEGETSDETSARSKPSKHDRSQMKLGKGQDRP